MMKFLVSSLFSQNFLQRHFSLMRFLHDGVLLSQGVFLNFVVVLDLFVDLWIRWIFDKAKRVLKVEPSSCVLRMPSPDRTCCVLGIRTKTRRI